MYFRKFYIFIVLAVATTSLFSPAAFAKSEDEQIDYGPSTMTGSWGGLRNNWAEKGVALDLSNTTDLFNNISGGISRGQSLASDFDASLTLDGEKLFNSRGTTIMVELNGTTGGQPDYDLVNSVQGYDNIETEQNSFQLYQAYVEQKFFGDKLSVLVGVYEMNTDFYVTDSSRVFMHYTYSFGSEFGLSGQNGPPSFPFTAPAVRVKYTPNDDYYIETMVSDGLPNDQNYNKGTHFGFHRHDGLLFTSEAGYTPKGGKIAVGAWGYTEQQPDFIETDRRFHRPIRKTNDGAYLIAERKIYSEHDADEQGLSVFGHIGYAEGDVNQIDYSYSTGFTYVGLIPSRDEGILGLGFNTAHNSDKYRKSERLAGDFNYQVESGIELTYSDNIYPWLNIQPDFQYIKNPGTTVLVDDAYLIGLRLTFKI